MDVSGSVESRFGFEKEAATGFLQHLIRPGYDRAFVVGFNQQSRLTRISPTKFRCSPPECNA